MESRSDDRDGDKPQDDKPQANKSHRDKRDGDRKPTSKPVQSGRVLKQSASKRREEKAAERVAKLKKIEESKKSGEEYPKENEDMQEVARLEGEVKEIDDDDNNYKAMEGVEMTQSIERDPAVVPSDGGLLPENEFITGSAETLGGEAVATAGRYGTVVRFGTQATAMYKFAVGIDGGPSIPDISDKYVDGHRLCSKGVKKGEWQGMGAQIRQIYGVVWDWRGTEDPVEAVKLLDPMVMKAGLLSKKERRKAQAAQKKPDFPEKDKVEFVNFPTTYVLTGWRHMTDLTWEQASDYKARLSKDPCIGEGQILRAARGQLDRYNQTDLGKEEAEARQGRLLSKSLSPPPSDAPAATASPAPALAPVSAPAPAPATAANADTPPSSVTPAPAVDAEYQEFIQGHLKESCVKLGKTFRSLSPAEKAQMMANARVDYEAQKALDF